MTIPWGDILVRFAKAQSEWLTEAAKLAEQPCQLYKEHQYKKVPSLWINNVYFDKCNCGAIPFQGMNTTEWSLQ